MKNIKDAIFIKLKYLYSFYLIISLIIKHNTCQSLEKEREEISSLVSYLNKYTASRYNNIGNYSKIIYNEYNMNNTTNSLSNYNNINTTDVYVSDFDKNSLKKLIISNVETLTDSNSKLSSSINSELLNLESKIIDYKSVINAYKLEEQKKQDEMNEKIEQLKTSKLSDITTRKNNFQSKISINKKNFSTLLNNIRLLKQIINNINNKLINLNLVPKNFKNNTSLIDYVYSLEKSVNNNIDDEINAKEIKHSIDNIKYETNQISKTINQLNKINDYFISFNNVRNLTEILISNIKTNSTSIKDLIAIMDLKCLNLTERLNVLSNKHNDNANKIEELNNTTSSLKKLNEKYKNYIYQNNKLKQNMMNNIMQLKGIISSYNQESTNNTENNLINFIENNNKNNLLNKNEYTKNFNKRKLINNKFKKRLKNLINNENYIFKSNRIDTIL